MDEPSSVPSAIVGVIVTISSDTRHTLCAWLSPVRFALLVLSPSLCWSLFSPLFVFLSSFSLSHSVLLLLSCLCSIPRSLCSLACDTPTPVSTSLTQVLFRPQKASAACSPPKEPSCSPPPPLLAPAPPGTAEPAPASGHHHLSRSIRHPQ